MARAEDLIPIEFPKLSWEPQETVRSLEVLSVYVTEKANKAISWYYVKRNRMRFMGSALRCGAIISKGVAGIIPVLGTILRVNNVPRIDPAWSAMALATTALLVAIDKFGGYTSAWVLYVLAAQEIDLELEAFRTPGRLKSLSWEIP